MYQITFNDEVVYDPFLQDRGYVVTQGKVITEVNSTGSASITLPPNNPSIGAITRIKGKISISDESGTVFRGRVIRDRKTFLSERELTVEGELAYLNDSIVPPYNFPEDYADDPEYLEAAESGNVVKFWLGKLISGHNETVSGDQAIQLGTVTVSDPNNYITRSNESYSTTWETILGKLVKSSLGGYIVARYEVDGTYIDYLADLPLTNVQKVEIQKNLLDLNKETDEANFYSVVVPIGVDGLTIADLPDGNIDDDIYKVGLGVHSRSRETAFGVVSKVIEHDDITITENLRRAAIRDFDGSVFPVTINCRAADLHGVDGSVPRFRVARNVIVKSGNETETYPLTKLSLDILNPGKTEIQMSRSSKTLSSSIGDAISSSLRPINAKIIKTAADAQAAIRSSAMTITQETAEKITNVLQDTEKMISEAVAIYTKQSDFEYYQETVSSALTQMADNITITLNDAKTYTDLSTADAKSVVSEISKWFKFSRIGFIIGASNGQVRLRLDNDRVEYINPQDRVISFYQPGKFYMSELSNFQIGDVSIVMLTPGTISFTKGVI